MKSTHFRCYFCGHDDNPAEFLLGDLFEACASCMERQIEVGHYDREDVRKLPDDWDGRPEIDRHWKRSIVHPVLTPCDCGYGYGWYHYPDEKSYHEFNPHVSVKVATRSLAISRNPVAWICGCEKEPYVQAHSDEGARKFRYKKYGSHDAAMRAAADWIVHEARLKATKPMPDATRVALSIWVRFLDDIEEKTWADYALLYATHISIYWPERPYSGYLSRRLLRHIRGKRRC